MLENVRRDIEAVRRRSAPELFVVDADLNVILSTQHVPAPIRLPQTIEDGVRNVLDRVRTVGPATFVHESRTVRVMPATNGRTHMYFVLVERLRAAESIDRAITTFGFTSRERDVLAQLVRGQSNAEIASYLGIGERTVGDHIKQIALKTESHSRSKIVARVLGLI